MPMQPPEDPPSFTTKPFGDLPVLAQNSLRHIHINIRRQRVLRLFSKSRHPLPLSQKVDTEVHQAAVPNPSGSENHRSGRPEGPGCGASRPRLLDRFQKAIRANDVLEAVRQKGTRKEREHEDVESRDERRRGDS